MASKALKDQDIIKEVAEELLRKLDVEAVAEVVIEDDLANVTLDTQESGLIIGYHGEVLEAVQLLTSLISSRRIGHFVRVSVEVGDYKKNRTEYLEQLAEQTKDRVIEEGRSHTLSSLKSWERRIIHLILQDDGEVISESMGEGRDRVLVIKPRS